MHERQSFLKRFAFKVTEKYNTERRTVFFRDTSYDDFFFIEQVQSFVSMPVHVLSL